MADKQISQLAPATALTDGTLFVAEQSGASKSVNFGLIKSYISPDNAPLFSTSASYAVNDYAIYNANLYRFTAAKAAGAWDSSKVTQTTVGAELTALHSPSALAPVYSPSTYPVGAYVFHDGTLHRCTTAINAAESWTAAHWTAAAIGNDVAGLKSALGEVDNAVFAVDTISASWTEGKRVIPNSNTYNIDVRDGTGYFYTKLPVTPGDVFLITAYVNSASYPAVTFADEDNIWIQPQYLTEAGTQYTDEKVTAPMNAAFMYVQSRGGDKGIKSVKNRINEIEKTASNKTVRLASVNCGTFNHVHEGYFPANPDYSTYLKEWCKMIDGTGFDVFCLEDFYPFFDNDWLSRTRVIVSSDVISTQANSNYVCKKISVTPGDKYLITTKVNSASYPGVVYGKIDDTFVDYDLTSVSDYTDFEITVPVTVEYMWVQGYGTDPKIVKKVAEGSSVIVTFTQTIGAQEALFYQVVQGVIDNGSERQLLAEYRTDCEYIGELEVTGSGENPFVYNETTYTSGRRFAEKIKVNVGGRDVVIYYLHFVPGTTAGWPGAFRHQQFLDLIADAQTYDNTVFIGDFNCHGIGEYDVFTSNGYKICNGGRTGDYLTLRDAYADNIICSANLCIDQFAVLSDYNLSTDHYPVVGTIRYIGT